jgi:ribosome-associated translation inhibitor RaiA
MPISVTTTFRRVRGTEPLQKQIQERVEKLGTYGSSILGARVLVELAERHRHDGNHIHVRINLALRGETLVVDQRVSTRPTARARGDETVRKQDEIARDHRRAKVAIREAFDAARRRLQDRERRLRGDVKTHAPERRRALAL